jgi:prefoldin beta subunit
MTTVIDAKVKDFQAKRAELDELMQQKATIMAQYNENTLVQGEFGKLKEDDPVYKLVGPVLMRVEFDDAKENVQKRLEYIEGEVKRIEGAINSKQEEIMGMSKEISAMQSEMQAEAAKAAMEAAQAAGAAQA